MRQGQNSRRSRGRGGNNNPGGGGGGGGGGGPRRQNVPLRHQNYDSNGPDVRIRGNAFQVYEKYLALARDAHTSGDRVAAENYFQHAEHYFRIINQITEQENRQRPGGQRHDANGHAQGNGMDQDGDDTDGSDQGEDDRETVNA